MKQLLVVFALVVGVSQVVGRQVCEQRAQGTIEANPFNCREFYMCRTGRPVVFSCPAGMNFDVTTGTCANQARCAMPQASDSNDWANGINPQFSPIEASASVLLLRSTVCVGSRTGTILPDTTSCRTFFQCLQQGVLRLECPAGTLFDSNRQFCESADLASCTYEPNGGANPGTGPGNMLKVLCFGKKPATKYAHPTNCTQYFLCNGRNDAQVFSCPPGTAYHKDRKVCDFAHNVVC